jgi:hypothetical protein
MPPSFPGRMISCSRDNSPASTDDPGYLGSSRIRKFTESLVRMPRAERRTQIWTVRHVPPPSPSSPPLHLIPAPYTPPTPPLPLSPCSPVVPCGVRMQAHCGPVACCGMRLQAHPPQLPTHTDAYPSGRHHSNRNDEGTATAAVAAVLPTARAGPPGWRRRRVPRTGPGASAPGGRAGSGGYDEGATAAAVAGPPGWRRRRVPRTGPGASSPGGRAGSGAAAAAVVAAALPTALAGPPGRPCREPRTDPGASARAPA